MGSWTPGAKVSRMQTAAVLGAPVPRRMASFPEAWRAETICEGGTGRGVSHAERKKGRMKKYQFRLRIRVQN